MQKKMFRIFMQSLIFIVLLELVLRIVFYQRVGREKLAVIETAKDIKRKIMGASLDQVYQHFLLARPDSTRETNKQIAQEAFESNHFEYTPWTEYKNIDYAGKYIHTKGLIRASVPDAFINPDTAAVQTIYFFGGSTMYGINITDGETIASAFINQYKEQFPHGVSVKVINYGVSAYHSYNELMLLSHLVYSGQKPGLVIMMDGLNNFLMPSAVIERRPYYYYRLRQASKDHINFKELEQINDSTNNLFDYPAGYNENQLTDTLVKCYLSDIDQVKKMAHENGFDAFFFIQPNPFYNYPNKKNDPVCDKEMFPLVTKAYSILEKKATVSEHIIFLGNMLQNEKGYPFIDRFHYSPSMCKKIAGEIAAVTGKYINKH